MKRIVLLFFLVNLSCISLRAQCLDESFLISFDNSYCLERLTIDTAFSHHNIWQIGLANKVELDSTVCATKVIITDTAQPYPNNDTSVFIIKHIVTPGIYYDGAQFSAKYYVQSDSLKDYGRIEFSPDHGSTWVDIINDTNYNYNFQWYPKPVLTGKTHTCQNMYGMFFDLGSTFNLIMGDTVLFRFSFISDSLFDNLGGLMFDEIQFHDFIEGMAKIRFKTIRTNIYPNPGNDLFTIDFDNPDTHPFQLKVYDIRSKMVYIQEDITANKVVLHTPDYAPDTYVYKLTDLNAQKRGWGKFVITR